MVNEQYIEQLCEIAQKCLEESDIPAAINCYQKIASLQPDVPDIYLKLGEAFYQEQAFPQAEIAYQQAIKLQPEQPRNIYEMLASSLVEQKKYAQAIAIYVDLIESYPSSAPAFYVRIGDIYLLQDKFFIAKGFWQKAKWTRAVFNINQVIGCIDQYFAAEGKLRTIDILDNGCDPTGQQLALLAEQTTGKVIGTNIYPGFPEQTVKRCRINNEFYWMDGQNLTFADSSFDLVISLNVLEHVPNPDQYLQECYRVLRPGGIGFFSWYPIWSGATGHHIHPDMVSKMAQRLNIPPPNYSLDGNSIPFWGHLLFSAEEMVSFLVKEKKYDLDLAQWMRDYTYYGNDLNRWFWLDMRNSFQKIAWNIIDEQHQGKKSLSSTIKQRLSQKYGQGHNFEICGAKIIVRK